MLVAVEFLGRTRVIANGREIPFSRQCLAFLAYLILNREVDHPREALIERFWAEQEPARARSSLGSALCRLKKALLFDGLSYLELSSRGEPRISSSAPIWLDVAAFEAGVRPALSAGDGRLDAESADQLIAGLHYYRGDLLTGWYDDWVFAERERLRVSKLLLARFQFSKSPTLNRFPWIIPMSFGIRVRLQKKRKLSMPGMLSTTASDENSVTMN